MKAGGGTESVVYPLQKGYHAPGRRMAAVVYARTLARAAYLVGGVDALAEQLGVSPDRVGDRKSVV